MGLALSGGRVVLRMLDTTSVVADLAAKIIPLLTWCGWVVESTTTHGVRLQAESPQGMDVFLYIEDLGHRLNIAFNQTLSFRFETIDGTVIGQSQEIEIGASGGYEFWANQCSLMVAQRGVGFNSGGGLFIGGIPFVVGAGSCNGKIQADTTTQAFWSMNDFNTGYSPRIRLITSNNQRNAEAGWNSNYSAGGDNDSSLRIPALVTAPNIDNGFNFPSRIIWRTYDEFMYEPFLVWGVESGEPVRLRGTAYDMVCFTLAKSLETKFSRDNLAFYNITDNWVYGGLGLLITSIDPNAGNVLYTQV